MDIWAPLMIIAGGLFAGGAATFAWSRVPVWRRMATSEYVRDFEQTIDRTDKVQPLLLILAVVTAILYALSTEGLPRILSFLGAGGLILVLVASLAVLVPLQRRIVSAGGEGPGLEDMRRRWDQGNLGRAVLSVVAFAALAGAVTV